MTQSGRYHGGLVFFGSEDGALNRFSRIVTATLEDYGHPVERQSLLDARQGRIVTSHYLVKLTLAEASSTGFSSASDTGKTGKRLHRLEIDFSPVSPGSDDEEVSQLILVVMLYRMVDIFATRSIEWLDPGTVLTLDQFLGAFTDVSPRRVHGHSQDAGPASDPFGSVGETADDLIGQYDEKSLQSIHRSPAANIDPSEEEVLSLAYRFNPRSDQIDAITPEDAAQNDIRRLATWGMTGMVAFLSAPVALSLAAVNIAKGEDFRLNTHVLSLTGLLVMLQSSGALASVMSHLPN